MGIADLAGGSFALAILDYSMPGMSGLELAGKLALRCPELPIIVMSGNTALMDREEASASGVRMVMGKPIRAHELASAISRLLRRADRSS